MPAKPDTVAFDEDLEQRYRTLSSWLRRMISLRHGLGRADAEEVVQESFIRFARYSPADRSRYPRALLLRIAANVGRDIHRWRVVRRADLHGSLEDLPHRGVAVLVQPSDQEFLIDLKGAILALPEPLRTTFLLARFTPLTHSEIAARLNVSTKTVEWRICKAVGLCLAQLKD